MNALLLLLILILLLIPPTSGAAADKPSLPYFTITVVDDQTGRGVPLVELETTNHITYVTDSNGIAAVYEHGLMGRDVYFHVKSHGYSYTKDEFGYAGLTLKLEPEGSATIRIKRENIAERLYRITGEGIYADSLLVGRSVPLKNPTISGLVMGQDSVLTAVYQGRVYWFWGDTDRPAYPLGNFRSSGATSELPARGGLDPDVGIDLTYFVNAEGFSKEMVPSDTQGPIWLGGLLTLPDANQAEHLFAMYSNVNNQMQAQEIGLVEFDDKAQVFRKIAKFPLDTPIQPNGHPFRVKDQGIEYIYFSPVTRVRADLASYRDRSKYEAFTCLREGSDKDDLRIERTSDGKPVFAWKPNTPALFPADEAQFIKDGKLKTEDALFHIQDVATGKPVRYHGASIEWNEYRKRWVMIIQEAFGTSFLGETWYLEADTPLGPWVYARKIVTHDNYSFYNVRHHPMFDKDGGRIIYFEGTYTNGFTSNQNPTARYNYNQIMYKLDLADPRLILPVPVYETGISDLRLGISDVRKPHTIAFFACDRPADKCVPVYQYNGTLVVGKAGSSPLFYALPADTQNPPPTTTPLYEFTRYQDGSHAYSIDPAWSRQGFIRNEKPLCLVWKNPMTVELP